MGFSCPVCDYPQADGRHLANHLAFTALVRGTDHEAWLDEHVPEWESLDDNGLAARVTEFAEETEYPQVFEDTTGQRSHEERSRERSSDRPGDPADVPLADVPDQDELDEEAEAALQHARELTRQRRENRSGDAGDGDDEPEHR